MLEFFQSKEKYVDPKKSRQYVAALVVKVMTGDLCVREAINKFPPDFYDSSVQCVWHALVHYEADEDFRRRDYEYRRQQDDYLIMLSEILSDGSPLPQNIIDEYSALYPMAMVPREKGFKGMLKSLFRYIDTL